MIPHIEADAENHLCNTLWVPIDATINTVVAGSVFKCPPNENGEVELGAGALDGFLISGYMTETKKLLCGYAIEHMHLKSSVANCLPDNLASQRTLEKCSFAIMKKVTGVGSMWLQKSDKTNSLPMVTYQA